MERDNFNTKINETIELGDQLIFKQFVERDFSNFENKVSKICRLGVQILWGKVQLKIYYNTGTM